MALNMSTGFVAGILGPSSFDQIFQDGAIEIRSGSQPANADAPVTGDLLARITQAGGAWLAGSPSSGLRWFRSGRYAFASPDQSWQLVGLATGEAGWFRMVGNAFDDGGSSTTAPRIDGAIGLLPDLDTPSVSDIQLYLPTLTIAPGSSMQIGEAVWFTFPPLE